MVARALLPLVLAAIGLVKAGAVIAIGVAVGLPALIVSAAAALWITGPATVAWVIADRRAKAKAAASCRTSGAAPSRP